MESKDYIGILLQLKSSHIWIYNLNSIYRKPSLWEHYTSIVCSTIEKMYLNLIYVQCYQLDEPIVLPIHTSLTTDGFSNICAPLTNGANGVIWNPFGHVDFKVHSFGVRHFELFVFFNLFPQLETDRFIITARNKTIK